MSNYYTMRDAKVTIAHQLMNRGWEVLGYKADESESMTDYYSPADWDGVAIKNGFILCVDTPYEAKSTPIKKYNPEAVLSFDDQEKINKLQRRIEDSASSPSEKEKSQAIIEKIKSNIKDDKDKLEQIKIIFIAPTLDSTGMQWYMAKIYYLDENSNLQFWYDSITDEYLNSMIKV